MGDNTDDQHCGRDIGCSIVTRSGTVAAAQEATNEKRAAWCLPTSAPPIDHSLSILEAGKATIPARMMSCDATRPSPSVVLLTPSKKLSSLRLGPAVGGQKLQQTPLLLLQKEISLEEFFIAGTTNIDAAAAMTDHKKPLPMLATSATYPFHIEWANSSWSQAFGWSSEEVQGE
jgi:hypothetical protein